MSTGPSGHNPISQGESGGQSGIGDEIRLLAASIERMPDRIAVAIRSAVPQGSHGGSVGGGLGFGARATGGLLGTMIGRTSPMLASLTASAIGIRQDIQQSISPWRGMAPSFGGGKSSSDPDRIPWFGHTTIKGDLNESPPTQSKPKVWNPYADDPIAQNNSTMNRSARASPFGTSPIGANPYAPGAKWANYNPGSRFGNRGGGRMGGGGAMGRVSFPTAAGAVGAAAQAGWKMAGTYLAKGVSAAHGVGGLIGLAGLAGSGVGLAALAIGTGLRAVQAGFQISELTHAYNSNRVAPYSGRMQGAIIAGEIGDIRRDMQYARETEATAVAAEVSRNKMSQGFLPLEIKAGNFTNRVSSASTNVMEWGATMADQALTGIARFSHNMIGMIPAVEDTINGIAKMPDLAVLWKATPDQIHAAMWAAAVDGAMGGDPVKSFSDRLRSIVMPDNAAQDVPPMNQWMMSFAAMKPQPFNTPRPIGLIPMGR